MKLNWGHKIAMVYLVFVLGMLGMLYKSLQMSHELVTDNYYEEELNYQARIDAWNNLAKAPFSVRIEPANEGIEVYFDDLAQGEVPQGTVHLYKPEAAGLDENHSLQINPDGVMHLTPKKSQGKYKVGVRFSINGTEYYAEKEIDL